VILIDEYDKPIIDHLGKGDKELQIGIQNRDILQDFFGVLKESSIVDIIQFVFVTGVSRFSKVSIFSKWNNLQDISMRGEFADFLGYTENEVKTYFMDYLQELAREYEVTVDEIMERLKFYYDGYRFSKKNVRVFNPVSIMYCLNNRDFSNYWFSTATPSFLVNLIKEKNYYIPDLENIKTRSIFLEAFDIEDLNIVSLLFQAGYLTIKDYKDERFYLSYPNEEVKKSFTEILMQSLVKKESVVNFADELGIAFQQEDLEDIKYYINAIFSEIPYPHYKKTDENYFHTIIYLSLTLGGYNAKSELLSSRGRLDMVLIFKDKVYVIEFKCNSSAKEALKQIKEKKYGDRWINKGIRVILCGISFDTKDKEVKDIVFEEV
ncbi:PD-(D/E)XK nuclease domain-containing protein, partial [Desulfovulcanus sp.]